MNAIDAIKSDITIQFNSTTLTKEQAIEQAREVNDQSGLAVAVDNRLGDTVFFITSDGREVFPKA